MKTFVNHVYDIDIINIYNLLDNKLSKDTSEKGKANKKEFLERLVYSIRQIIEVDKEGYKITIDEYDSLPSYVITPDKNFDNYVYWLGLFLLANPSFKTHLILEYHFNRWSNKMMLLNIIEFYVIDNVDENFFLQDETVVKYVSDWILYKRLHSGYSSSNPKKSSNSSQSTKNKEKKDTDLIVIDDLQYKSKENQSPEKGDVLDSSTEEIVSVKIVFGEQVIEALKGFLGERLYDKSDKTRLNSVLSGNHVEGLINISISRNNFIGLLRGLQENGYVYEGNKTILAKWLVYNFSVSSKEITTKGKFNQSTTSVSFSKSTLVHDNFDELVIKHVLLLREEKKRSQESKK